MNSPDFKESVNILLKEKYQTKIEDKEIIKKYKNTILKFNKDFIKLQSKEYPKELSSFGIKKSTYKSVDDFLILAKFSDFQYIFNKSAKRTNYATNLLTLEPKYMDVPVLENKLKSDFENKITKEVIYLV